MTLEIYAQTCPMSQFVSHLFIFRAFFPLKNVYNGTANTRLKTQEPRPNTQTSIKTTPRAKITSKIEKRKIMLEKYTIYVCELATRHCLYAVCFLTHLFSTFSFQFFFSITASSYFHDVLVAVKWTGHV